MTYKEIIYMVIDELKLSSSDSYFNEDHIKFLAVKYRNLITKQRFGDKKKTLPIEYYQTLLLTLTEVPAISGEPCEGGSYLRSSIKIPSLLEVGKIRIYPTDFFQGEFTCISRERMRYVGNESYLQNFIYCTVAPDNYLYFKSSNPQFLNLKQVNLSAVFNDIEGVFNILNTTGTDIRDAVFPVEDTIVTTLIQLIVKELQIPVYSPSDENNNGSDDLSKSPPNQNYINAAKQSRSNNNQSNEEVQ